MPRTAPVPNMIAIPGMCPGVLIKAGGAGGGGSGAGGGKGKGGKKGARTKGGKDDAEGGKKNQGACGTGSNADGGCPNPKHGSGGHVTAGDPVDVVTGRVFTVPAVDLVLGGPFPFILRRTYSTSAVERDVGLGFGWSHTFAWEIQVKRRRSILWTSAGGKGEFATIQPGESAQLDVGALSRHAWGFLLCTPDGVLRSFVELEGTGRYLLAEVSDRNDNRIRLTYDRGVLVALTDSVGRVVRVRRELGGRIHAFEAPVNPEATQFHSLRTYRYNADGDLVVARNADGAETKFTYEAHRLTCVERPSGLVVHYKYDAQHRCVETWANYGDQPDPSLDEDVPELLADHITKAKGVHHIRIEFLADDYVEVADSRQVKRVFTNADGTADKLDWGGAIHSNHFDEHGELEQYTDGEQHTWRWQRDDEGRLLTAQTPDGSRLDFTYHPSGEPELISGPDADFVQYSRDTVGNPLLVSDQGGVVVQYEYNPQGQWVSAVLPNGGLTRCEYDAWGNRISVTEPDGSTKFISYDHWGRPVSLREVSGLETQYLYDDCGRLFCTRTNAGTERRTTFDAQGRVRQMIGPDRRPITLHYGGLDRVVRVERPDGSHVDYRYDREGGLVRIINENGEQHRLLRTSSGYIRQELTFDGRTVDYSYDANGEVRSKSDGPTKVDVVTGPTGEVQQKEYADGTVDEFEYDVRGRLLRARNAHSVVLYTYDGRGNVIGEQVVFGERAYTVRSDYNLATDRVSCILEEPRPLEERGRLEGSRRFEEGLRLEGSSAEGDGPNVLELERAKYDLMGRTTEVVLPGGDVRKTYDAAGNELTRRYHSGGTVRRQADLFGMPRQWEVFADGSFSGGGAGQAAAPGSPSWYQSFSYDAAGDVAEVAEPDGRTRYEHDALGRLAQRVTKVGASERYQHDVTGNWYPQGHREYGVGGRLLRHGDVRFTYNEAGFVVERTRTLSDGATLTTQFSWNGAGQLTSVTEPDGRHHTFVHDVFGRCLRQETSLGGATESSTVFTWDGERLVREQTMRYAPDGGQVEDQRHYAYEPGTIALLAERRQRWTLNTNGEGMASTESSGTPTRTLTSDTGWLFHEAAHDGSVGVLLFPDGRVAEHADIDPWGRLGQNHRSETLWRRQGQYQAPAGLYYNRHRFYDPDAGVYLSPEPLGIGESLKAYAYVDNYPHRVVDVDGLKMTATLTSTNPKSGKTSTRTQASGSKPQGLHPAVIAALPPNSARDPSAPVPPANCAEPNVLSDHIRAWEKRHSTPPPPKSCAPGDQNWRENLASAVGEIDEIRSHDADGPAAACPNCSQTIPRLAALAGVTPPRIGEGRDFSVPPRDGSHSTSLPTAAFSSNPANRMANTAGLTPNQAAAVGGLDLGIY